MNNKGYSSMGLLNFLFNHKKTQQIANTTEKKQIEQEEKHTNTLYDNLQYEILKRLKKIDIEHFEEIYPYFNDYHVRDIINDFWGKGYITKMSTVEKLNLLTIPELKKILKANSLKVSGRKQELIDRILAEINERELLRYLPSGTFVSYTDAGQKFYNCLLAKKEAEYNNLIIQSVNMVSKGEYSSAYSLICKYENRQFFKRGLGIDWNKSNLSKEDISAFDELKKYLNGYEYELSITFDMLGISYVKARNKTEWFTNYSNTETKYAKILYGMKLIPQLRSISLYRNTGTKYYQILGCNDDESCELCKNLNKQKFLVSRAKPGINLPPFCEKCRCAIISGDIQIHSDNTCSTKS